VGPRFLIGCSGGGVIGSAREAEFVPAVSLTAAVLPGVDLHATHLESDEMPDLDAPPEAWEKALGVAASVHPHFVLLAEPFSFAIDNFVMGLDYAFPRSAKIGGLASDGGGPGENVLFIGSDIHRSGGVALSLAGNVAVETVVAQGCRPIGRPLVVTDAHQNLVLEVDHRRPLDVLSGLLESLPPRDLALVRSALFLGIAMDASRQSWGAGDFLIRNVMGIDRNEGILAVGAHVRPGQVVQFHVRDAASSAEDLRAVLEVYLRSRPARASGALLFSCLGRGRHLYGIENHDCDVFAQSVGEIPLGGFFCNGEIGPVGTSGFVRTFVHGYTSCFGMFRASLRA
jgi:small ligand-binding sensory domain FIST